MSRNRVYVLSRGSRSVVTGGFVRQPRLLVIQHNLDDSLNDLGGALVAAGLRIDTWCTFRSDLPFPFGHYDCDLGILDTLDAKGRMTTYVFTPSNDFYWFAGQDWHHPLRSSDGAFQGLLLVRIAGFDMKSVPDGDSDRISGTRVALGNLKRRSEAAFRAYGGPPRTLSGAVPSFDVLARSK